MDGVNVSIYVLIINYSVENQPQMIKYLGVFRSRYFSLPEIILLLQVEEESSIEEQKTSMAKTAFDKLQVFTS